MTFTMCLLFKGVNQFIQPFLLLIITHIEILWACVCVRACAVVSNRQDQWTDKWSGTLADSVHILSSSDFWAVIHGDGEEIWADVLRYHNGVPLIDEDSDQRALPAVLFLVQISSRQQTQVMDVRLLINSSQTLSQASRKQLQSTDVCVPLIC